MALLDGKVLEPQTQNITYLGLKWDELQKVLLQRWDQWGQALGLAEESLH